MRLDGLPKLEDLREMSEEQFVEAFETLRERTRNWNGGLPELFRETPQLLFVMRIGLGLSQQKFADELGVQKQWIRNFESGRQGFKQSEVIPRLVDFLTEKFAGGADLQKSIKTLKICQLARERSLMKVPETEIKLKRIFEMEPKDFKEAFLILKDKTKGFREFSRDVLIEVPQFISIFRIILGMGILKFSKVLDRDDAHIRRWESLRERISPPLAEDLIEKIKILLKESGLIGKITLESALKSFEEFCFFEPDELKIKELLESEHVPFETHKELMCGKKKMSLDFLIGPETQKIALEVTKLSKRRKKDLITRVDILDHRFRILKTFHPKIKTAMFLECDSSQISLIERIVEREVFDTDIVIIKSFEELLTRIKQYIC